MTFVQWPDRSKEAGMSMSIQNTLIEEASSGQGCKGLMYVCVCTHIHMSTHVHTQWDKEAPVNGAWSTGREGQSDPGYQLLLIQGQALARLEYAGVKGCEIVT